MIRVMQTPKQFRSIFHRGIKIFSCLIIEIRRELFVKLFYKVRRYPFSPYNVKLCKCLACAARNIATEFCVRVTRRPTEERRYNLAEEEVTASSPRRAASRAARVRALCWGCWPSWTVHGERRDEGRDGERERETKRE